MAGEERTKVLHVDVAAVAETKILEKRGLPGEATDGDEGAILTLGDAELRLGVVDLRSNGAVDGLGGGRIKVDLDGGRKLLDRAPLSILSAWMC